MPIGIGRTRTKWKSCVARPLLVSSFIVLVACSLGTSLRAQDIRFKLVNGRNGRPMSDACLNVWVGTERIDALSIPTDKEGVAALHLSDSEAKINTRNRWPRCGAEGVINPVLKYADSIKINAGYASCQPHTADYSWLAVQVFSTKKVLESGVVTPNACGKVTASPEPGEIIMFVRPLSWWEKLKS
jgi:hypothetical protein